MEKQSIKITVTETGELVGDVIGGHGVGCMDKLDELMRGLATTTESNRKPDFFNQGQGHTNSVHVEDTL